MSSASKSGRGRNYNRRKKIQYRSGLGGGEEGGGEEVEKPGPPPEYPTHTGFSWQGGQPGGDGGGGEGKEIEKGAQMNGHKRCTVNPQGGFTCEDLPKPPKKTKCCKCRCSD